MYYKDSFHYKSHRNTPNGIIKLKHITGKSIFRIADSFYNVGIQSDVTNNRVFWIRSQEGDLAINARFMDAVEGWKTAIQCSCDMIRGEAEQEEESPEDVQYRLLDDITTFLVNEYEQSCDHPSIQSILTALKTTLETTLQQQQQQALAIHSISVSTTTDSSSSSSSPPLSNFIIENALNRLQTQWISSLSRRRQSSVIDGNDIQSGESAEVVNDLDINTSVGEVESQFDHEMRATFEVIQGGSMEGVPLLRTVDIVDVQCSASRIAFLTDTGDLYISKRSADETWKEPVLNQFLSVRRILQNSRIQMVALGKDHVLVLLDSGFVYSWGKNTYGQLGVSGSSSEVPQLVSTLLETRIVAIAAGDYHSLAVDEKGVVYAWGWNQDGQCGLGEGTAASLVIPTRIPTTVLPSCRGVAAGEQFSVFVTAEGQVLACGKSRDGRCGAFDGDCLRVPRLVSGFPPNTKIKKVACGVSFSVALDDQGNL